MLEPSNLTLEVGELKTLYFYHNVRHFKSITATDIYRWSLIYEGSNL